MGTCVRAPPLDNSLSTQTHTHCAHKSHQTHTHTRTHSYPLYIQTQKTSFGATWSEGATHEVCGGPAASFSVRNDML